MAADLEIDGKRADMSDIESTAKAKTTAGLAGAVTGAIALGVVAMLLAFVAIACPRGGRSETSTTSAGAGTTKTFDIELFDIGVKPKSIDVPKGAEVVLNVKNTGQAQHDLALNGGSPTTKLLGNGESETLKIGAVSATTAAWCTIPGHKEAGMNLVINVTDGASGAPTAAAAAAGTGTDPADAKIDFDAKPAADWKPFDPTLKPADGATTHTIDIHAKDTVIEVAPGVTQELWTFDGQTPGPTYRGHIGDVFNFTLINDGKEEHSIDFHASKVAWNDEMRSIKPGERLTYQFKAEFAGAYMYHCGTAPALHHIGNGMFGAIIIDPPNLPPVAHEYFLGQSELYTGPMGKPGDLKKMTTSAWDAVVFNGYVNQYKFMPIRVEKGERIRVWVVDEGPSENSAFHIVGTVFDTVFKEGSYLLTPDQRQGGSQVLDLQPAQGGFVEFTFAEDGLYPIVTHKFVNVGKGALGLFQAGEVKPAPGAAH